MADSMELYSDGYIAASTPNDPHLCYEWPRNTFYDPHHMPEDERDWQESQETVPLHKHVTLRLMHSDGSWPPGVFENVVLTPSTTEDDVYTIISKLFARLCAEKFGNAALLSFNVARIEDKMIVVLSHPSWKLMLPTHKSFVDKKTHLIHALPKYVHFICEDKRESLPTGKVILQVKFHETSADIVDRLAVEFGYAEVDELVAFHRGQNVPLSWLALPHHPLNRDKPDLNVLIAKKAKDDVVQFSYATSNLVTVSRHNYLSPRDIATNITQQFDKLAVVAEGKFKSNSMSDSDYRARLQTYWKDLCPDMCLVLPKQSIWTQTQQEHIIPMYGLEKKKYCVLVEPTDTHSRTEQHKPFSEWSDYLKYCLCILAQLTAGNRAGAMFVLRWCVLIRHCQGHTLKNVVEVLPGDVKVAISFFERLMKANERGHKGSEKWNHASEDEKQAIMDASHAAHDILDELNVREEREEMKKEIDKITHLRREAKRELADVRKRKPIDKEQESDQKAIVEGLTERREELEKEYKLSSRLRSQNYRRKSSTICSCTCTALPRFG